MGHRLKSINQLLKDFYSYQKLPSIEEFRILGDRIKKLEETHKVSLKESLELGVKVKKFHNFIIKTFFLLLGIILFPVWIFYIINALKDFSFSSLSAVLLLFPLLALITLICNLFLFMMFYLIFIMMMQKILPFKSVKKTKLLDTVKNELEGFKKTIFSYERDIEYICKYNPEATWIRQSGIRSSPDVLAFWIIDICKKPELSIFKKESDKFYKLLLMRIAFIIEDYKLKKFEDASAVFGIPLKTEADLEKIAKKYIKDKDARESYWEFYKKAISKQAFYLEQFEKVIKR